MLSAGLMLRGVDAVLVNLTFISAPHGTDACGVQMTAT